MNRVPTGIHKAIGLLLKCIGSVDHGDEELEGAWNLISEWWEQVPVGGESGIEPY
jgi:hypothetical protein